MFSLLNAQALLGIVLILALCWAMSEDRKRFPWRLAIGAVALQAVLVLMLFGIPGSQVLLNGMSGG